MILYFKMYAPFLQLKRVM